MTEVFISYKRQDQGVAATVANRLEAAGFDVWWDRWLVPGDDYNEAIGAALSACRAVIVLWSAGGNASQWVFSEMRQGAAERKLIPIRLDDTPVPNVWGPKHALDFRGLGKKPSNDAMDRLVEAVSIKVRGEAARRSRPNQFGGVDLVGLGDEGDNALRAAKGGDLGQAFFVLGRSYREGRAGKEPDRQKAIRLLRLAASYGHVTAKHYLARIFSEADANDDQRAQALAYLREAAEDGSREAQFSLALRLHPIGQTSATKSSAEARQWLERAAKQGLARAQHNYAVFCFDGIGGPVQFEEGYKWLVAACLQGTPEACFELAEMIRRGEAKSINAERLLYMMAHRTGRDTVREAARTSLAALGVHVEV